MFLEEADDENFFSQLHENTFDSSDSRLNVLCFDKNRPLESLKFTELHELLTIYPSQPKTKFDVFSEDEIYQLRECEDEFDLFYSRDCFLNDMNEYIDASSVKFKRFDYSKWIEDNKIKHVECLLFENFDKKIIWDEVEKHHLTAISKREELLHSFFENSATTNFNFPLTAIGNDYCVDFDTNCERYIDPKKFYNYNNIHFPIFQDLNDLSAFSDDESEDNDEKEDEEMEENSEEEEEEVEKIPQISNPFNISLDHYYRKKAAIRKNNVYCRQNHDPHAYTSIPFVNLPYTARNLLKLHTGYQPRRNIRHKIEFSRYPHVIFEYTDEDPMILQNVGMCSQIQTFYATSDNIDYGQCKEHSRGRPIFIEEGDHFPLIHKLEPGLGNATTTLTNNLTTALISKPKKTDDFLLRKVGNKYVLSNISDVYNIGQLHPNVPIPSIGSSGYNTLITKRVALFIISFLKKFGQIKFSQIAQVFPEVAESTIRQQLIDFCEFDGCDKYFLSKHPKKEIPQLSPEDNCILESITSHYQKLLKRGVSSFVNTYQFNIARDYCMKNPKVWPIFEPIFVEMSKMPWNWSDSYLSTKNKRSRVSLELGLAHHWETDSIPIVTIPRKNSRPNKNDDSISEQSSLHNSASQKKSRKETNYDIRINNIYKKQLQYLDEIDLRDSLDQELVDLADELDNLFSDEDDGDIIESNLTENYITDAKFLRTMHRTGKIPARIKKPLYFNERKIIKVYRRVPLTEKEKLQNPGCYDKLVTQIIRDPELIKKTIQIHNSASKPNPSKPQIHHTLNLPWVAKFEEISKKITQAPKSTNVTKRNYKGKIQDADVLFITLADLGDGKAHVKCKKHRPPYRDTQYKEQVWKHLKIQLAYCFRNMDYFPLSCSVCDFKYDFNELDPMVRKTLDNISRSILPPSLKRKNVSHDASPKKKSKSNNRNSSRKRSLFGKPSLFDDTFFLESEERDPVITLFDQNFDEKEVVIDVVTSSKKEKQNIHRENNLQKESLFDNIIIDVEEKESLFDDITINIDMPSEEEKESCFDDITINIDVPSEEKESCFDDIDIDISLEEKKSLFQSLDDVTYYSEEKKEQILCNDDAQTEKKTEDDEKKSLFDSSAENEEKIEKVKEGSNNFEEKQLKNSLFTFDIGEDVDDEIIIEIGSSQEKTINVDEKNENKKITSTMSVQVKKERIDDYFRRLDKNSKIKETIFKD